MIGNGSPLVSVLIPTFNSAELVNESIDSALTQTHSNVEVIVVDDGSSDHTEDVLRSYGSRIQWQKIQNSGACVARNIAFGMSRGEYIQFLDADDLLLPEKLALQLPDLQRNLADIVVANGYLFGDERPQRPIKQTLSNPNGVDPFVYCLQRGLSTLGPLIRRSFVEQSGGFDPLLRRAQEFEFHLRVAALDARVSIVAPLLFAVRHDNRPTRITNRKLPPDYTLNLLLQLSAKLEHEPYKFTRLRRQALANSIYTASMHAYRNGASEAADTGFIRASELSDSIVYTERKWFKWLVTALGPIRAEKTLAHFRSIREFAWRKSER